MWKVVVVGAAGQMGREIAAAVLQSENTDLVGVVDKRYAGADFGRLIGKQETGLIISDDLDTTLERTGAQVMVDFTNAEAAMHNITLALSRRVRPVVGTTGFQRDQLEQITKRCSELELGCIISPNFAIGALLLVKFAAEAAKYFKEIEIIELHHEDKQDAPSGTAIKTAEAVKEVIGFEQRHGNISEKITGVRGGDYQGVRIHSVRLPGLMAHQEVIFGGDGQTLTIRHDSISRSSYLQGIFLAINEVMYLKEMVYGLENLIFKEKNQ